MTGPLELKKIAYNIFFELMVQLLLAIHGRFWYFRFHCLLSALLCGSNMCTQVSSPVSKLEITRLLQPLCFQKFPGTFKALCLLLLSEQMRYPPNANLSQVQTLFQNCLHTAFWYVSTTSYIFDRQSRILFDHNLYSSNVSLGNRDFRPSRTGIIFNRKFPSFKSFNPPKNCAHWNDLRSIYTTKFIKYLLWIYIKPNVAFNIATNFSLLVHVPINWSVYMTASVPSWNNYQLESNLHEINGHR